MRQMWSYAQRAHILSSRPWRSVIKNITMVNNVLNIPIYVYKLIMRKCFAISCNSMVVLIHLRRLYSIKNVCRRFRVTGPLMIHMFRQIRCDIDTFNTHTSCHLFRAQVYGYIDVYLETVGLGSDSGTVSVTARSLLNCRITVPTEISRGCALATWCH